MFSYFFNIPVVDFGVPKDSPVFCGVDIVYSILLADIHFTQARTQMYPDYG
jgi:hypothetical protein